MSAEPSPSAPSSLPVSGVEEERLGVTWLQVVLAAVLMVATLPGRTQGLGLITEPMLEDLRLDRVVYANINLWATILGSVCCLPAGWLLDRRGLRWPATCMVVLLGAIAWTMSAFATGGVAFLFLCVLLTRAVGQSALSVASITAVGKSAGAREGMAMGVYSVLLSVLFAVAFVVVGGVVSGSGWRTAWASVSMALVFGAAPFTALFLRESHGESHPGADQKQIEGSTLSQALRTSVFWVFGLAIALFGLVSSGLGLFNEAVLAERGFSRETFHLFLAITTLLALVGQFGCGWLSQRWPMSRLLGVAMFLYAAALGALPMLRTFAHLWIFAAAFGIAGGMITVIFFAVWNQAFGRAYLGRIQGAAQMLSVFASAIGPLLFATCHERTGSYAPVLLILAPIVFALGIAAWRTTIASPFADVSQGASPPRS